MENNSKIYEVQLSCYHGYIVLSAWQEELPALLDFALKYELEIRIGVGMDAE